MTEAPRHPNPEAALRRALDVVIEAARQDPALRDRLATALADVETATRPTPKAKAPVAAARASADEAAPEGFGALNPIALASEEGGDALRDALRFTRRKEPLVKLARRYRLDVGSKTLKKKGSVSEMVDDIVSAALRRAEEQALMGG